MAKKEWVGDGRPVRAYGQNKSGARCWHCTHSHPTSTCAAALPSCTVLPTARPHILGCPCLNVVQGAAPAVHPCTCARCTAVTRRCRPCPARLLPRVQARLYRIFDLFQMLEHKMVVGQLAMTLIRNFTIM